MVHLTGGLTPKSHMNENTANTEESQMGDKVEIPDRLSSIGSSNSSSDSQATQAFQNFNFDKSVITDGSPSKHGQSVEATTADQTTFRKVSPRQPKVKRSPFLHPLMTLNSFFCLALFFASAFYLSASFIWPIIELSAFLLASAIASSSSLVFFLTSLEGYAGAFSIRFLANVSGRLKQLKDMTFSGLAVIKAESSYFSLAIPVRGRSTSVLSNGSWSFLLSFLDFFFFFAPVAILSCSSNLSLN